MSWATSSSALTDGDTETLGSWTHISSDRLGTTSCAMAVVTDVQLALAFVKALGEDAKYADLLADLTERVARVKKRQQEEKAHKNNIRHGKKRTK